MILGIVCKYKEYRLIDEKWKLVSDTSMVVDDKFINRFVSGSKYFCKLGGYVSFDFKNNRRFGLVCSKAFSMSICKTVKKVYDFNYNQAKRFEYATE